MSIADKLRAIENEKLQKVLLHYFRGSITLTETKTQIQYMCNHYNITKMDLAIVDTLLPQS